jgi:hypothetical protein
MTAYIRSKVSNNQSTEVRIEAENSTAGLRQDGSFKLPNASDANADSPHGSIRYNDTTDKLEFKNPVGWKSVDAYSDEEIVSEAELAETIATLSEVARTGRYSDLLEIPGDLASTSYVDSAIANLVDSAPDTLNTLNEIAQAISSNQDFSQTIFGLLDTKLNISGGALTGVLTLSADPIGPQDAVTKNYVDSVASGIEILSTADVPEDPVNLYYTASRATAAARSALTGGTGVSVNPATGVVAIGQDVSTTGNVTFNTVTTNQVVSTATGVPSINSATNIVLNAAGDVILNSPLVLKKYTTSELAELIADEGTLVFDTTVKRIKIYNYATWEPLAEEIDGGEF